MGDSLGLIADRLQPDDTLFQAGVTEIGDTGLDGVIQALEAKVSFRGALVQFGDMLTPPLGALLATVQHGGENLPPAKTCITRQCACDSSACRCIGL